MENEKFENVITDKKLKENFGDLAISLLANKGEIDVKSDLKHLRVEFGYLFKRQNQDRFETMFKMILPNKIFKSERVFYFGTQDDKLILLNDKFTEDTFRKIQSDMFSMHNVDAQNLNRRDYIMELY